MSVTVNFLSSIAESIFYVFTVSLLTLMSVSNFMTNFIPVFLYICAVYGQFVLVFMQNQCESLQAAFREEEVRSKLLGNISKKNLQIFLGHMVQLANNFNVYQGCRLLGAKY